jgi:hypothetical protein
LENVPALLTLKLARPLVVRPHSYLPTGEFGQQPRAGIGFDGRAKAGFRPAGGTDQTSRASDEGIAAITYFRGRGIDQFAARAVFHKSPSGRRALGVAIPVLQNQEAPPTTALTRAISSSIELTSGIL